MIEVSPLVLAALLAGAFSLGATVAVLVLIGTAYREHGRLFRPRQRPTAPILGRSRKAAIAKTSRSV